MGILSFKRRRRRRVINSGRDDNNFRSRPSARRNIRLTSRVKLIPHQVFKFSFLKIVLLLCLLLSGIYLVYWVGNTGYFNVKDINIEGNDNVPSEEILEVASINSPNIFTFNPGVYEARILEAFTYAKDVFVEKELPDKILIHINEREPFIVWRTVNGAYLLDSEGYVLAAAHDENVTVESIVALLESQKINEESREENEREEQAPLENIEEVLDEQLEKFLSEEGEKKEGSGIDPEIEMEIEKELKEQESALDISQLDFDQFFVMPDDLRKYPLIKVWSDEVFQERQSIDDQLLTAFLELQRRLSEKIGFKTKEVVVFSKSKVLVDFKEGWRAYFRLDEDVVSQVNALDFIYGRLKISGEQFSEIDMRYKRPILRR